MYPTNFNKMCHLINVSFNVSFNKNTNNDLPMHVPSNPCPLKHISHVVPEENLAQLTEAPALSTRGESHMTI